MKAEDQFAKSAPKLNMDVVSHDLEALAFLERMFSFLARCRGMNPRIEGFIEGLRVCGLIIDKEES